MRNAYLDKESRSDPGNMWCASDCVVSLRNHRSHIGDGRGHE